MAPCKVICLFLLMVGLSTANSDADALLAIKQQLGPSNANLSSWIGSNPCDPLWNGIQCAGGRVTVLNLTEFGLTGSFPNELRNVILLEVLDLHTNNITGPVPDSFSTLSTLRSLNLSANPIQGDFPRPILKIKGLLELYMGTYNLTGELPDEITNLSSLRTLHLNSNNLSGNVLDVAGRLAQLTELVLWGTVLNSSLPGNLGLRLRNLATLNLYKCGLQGALPVEWGGNFTKMTMDLHGNNLTGGIPESWSQMQSLKELNLQRNMLRGYVPPWLRNHATPSQIDLRCNYFSGPKPARYPQNRIKGNCFDEDVADGYRDHNRQCQSNLGCKQFFAIFPRPPPPPPPPPQTSSLPPTAQAESKSPTPQEKSKSLSPGAITGLTIGVLAVTGIFVILLVFWKRRQQSDEQDYSQPLEDWEVPQGIEKFSLEQISRATNGFSKSCEIGCGGFGRVYRGTLEDGRTVAVKQALKEHGRGHREFRNEIELLSRLHHRHLVQLLGFCQSGKTQILVYEFMENGNLHNCLLGKGSDQPLDSYQRLVVAVAVAEGLDYLHSYAVPPVIHRDFKPSNILLDKNFVPKISDFGISKVSPEFDTHVSTRPAGTAGYLDPDYFLRRQLTTASDVYSFGVLLLELVTGQKVIDDKRSDEINLVEWVKPRLRDEGIRLIIDGRIAANFPEE